MVVKFCFKYTKYDGRISSFCLISRLPMILLSKKRNDLPVHFFFHQVELEVVLGGTHDCSLLELIFIRDDTGPCESIRKCNGKETFASSNRTSCLVRVLLPCENPHWWLVNSHLVVVDGFCPKFWRYGGDLRRLFTVE